MNDRTQQFLGRSFLSAMIAIFFLVAVTGCSSKLSRREAKRLIEAQLKPHQIGLSKQLFFGVPGFDLTGEDVSSSTYLRSTSIVVIKTVLRDIPLPRMSTFPGQWRLLGILPLG